MIWIIAAAVIALDLISKYMIAGSGITDKVIIDGFFHITYVENTGMAWSMLSGKTALLALISAVAIGFMIKYVLDHKPEGITGIALALMIGGAAGNLYDRLVLGYVRDFLNFYIFGYDFPVFNIADSALCVGVFLLFVAAFMEDHKEKKTEDGQNG